MRQAYDYWQDQPGNCPYTHGTCCGTARGGRYKGLTPPSQARVSHRPIRVVPPARPPLDSPPSRTFRLTAPRSKFLVPRSHTPQERFPQSSGLGSTPFGEGYRRAAAPLMVEGAARTRRISKRLVAKTGLAIGHQVHLPLHRLQRCQTHLAKLTLPRLQGQVILHPQGARPRSHPKRAHPARQAHQPLGPGTASRPPSSIRRPRKRAPRAESTSALNRRSQHPRHFPPSTPHTPTFRRRSSRRQPFKAAAAAQELVPGESKACPSHA